MDHVSDTLLEVATRAGFDLAAPEPLVSPHFADTFAPSAFHELVRRAAAVSSPEQDFPAAGIQWVYRHLDIAAAPYSPIHALAFRMFVALRQHATGERASALAGTLSLLEDLLAKCRIKKRDLRVLVFGGYPDRGLPSDSLATDAWLEFGLAPESIACISGPALHGAAHRRGDFIGPRSEIFCSHPTLGAIEVGTLVTETDLLTSTAGGTEALPRQVTGVALGVERLRLVVSALDDIVELVAPGTYGATPSLVSQTMRGNLAGLGKCCHALTKIATLAPEVPRPLSPRLRQLLKAARHHQVAVGLGHVSWGDLARRLQSGREAEIALLESALQQWEADDAI